MSCGVSLRLARKQRFPISFNRDRGSRLVPQTLADVDLVRRHKVTDAIRSRDVTTTVKPGTSDVSWRAATAVNGTKPLHSSLSSGTTLLIGLQDASLVLDIDNFGDGLDRNAGGVTG